MNKVILVGRMARDPELRTTAAGQSVCRFAVAVDRRFKRDGQPTADFINIVSFGKQAELINQYLGKGRRIALEGRIQTGSYQAQDGTTKYTTDVILDSFDFIDSRSDGSGGMPNNGGNSRPSGNNYQNSNSNSNPNPPSGVDMDDDMDSDFQMMADDDDLPF